MKQLFDYNAPIIDSLLETDTYKIRMLYFIWKYFPDLETQFAFTNRTTGVPLADRVSVDQLKAELAWAQSLRFTDYDLAYLRAQDNYPEEFLTFLKQLTLSDITVSRRFDGQISIETAKDAWAKTTLWELIVLPIVSELRARQYLIDHDISQKAVIRAGEERLRAKAELLRGSGARAMQFSLRRRISGWWERHITQMANELMPGLFTAVSNIQLARELGMPMGGTNAHELSMALNALRWNDGPEAAWQSQYEVFEKWFELYGDPVRIILPDTFGSRQFLDHIPDRLLRLASGFRQDSGDPIVFGEWIVQAWEQAGIDPRTRTLFFSDGLTPEKMLLLQRTFAHITSVLFGWGTNFGNDTGIIPSLSIVMKLVWAAGNPAVKLGDNWAKAIGPEDAVVRNKTLYGHNSNFYEACVY